MAYGHHISSMALLDRILFAVHVYSVPIHVCVLKV